MYELSQAEFENVLPFFQQIPYLRAVVFSNLQGPQWGRAFVDQREGPNTAVVLSDNLYLSGRADHTPFNRELSLFIRAEVFPKPRYEHLQFFAFQEGWHAALKELFQAEGIATIQRSGFEFDVALWKQRHADWRDRIPLGFGVRRFDAQIAARVGGPVDMFGSVENFLRHGVGYVVMQGDEIVSNCQSVFVGGGHAEIALSTVEAYRRQGLATLATCAYIEECLSRGLIPDWQCYYNPASEQMALKMGFKGPLLTPIPYIHVPDQYRQPL